MRNGAILGIGVTGATLSCALFLLCRVSYEILAKTRTPPAPPAQPFRTLVRDVDGVTVIRGQWSGRPNPLRVGLKLILSMPELDERQDARLLSQLRTDTRFVTSPSLKEATLRSDSLLTIDRWKGQKVGSASHTYVYDPETGVLVADARSSECALLPPSVRDELKRRLAQERFNGQGGPSETDDGQKGRSEGESLSGTSTERGELIATGSRPQNAP